MDGSSVVVDDDGGRDDVAFVGIDDSKLRVLFVVKGTVLLPFSKLVVVRRSDVVMSEFIPDVV